MTAMIFGISFISAFKPKRPLRRLDLLTFPTCEIVLKIIVEEEEIVKNGFHLRGEVDRGIIEMT